MKVAGILRKSPTKIVEASKEMQQEIIKERVARDFPGQHVQIDWFFDVASGDDPNRPELLRFFGIKEQYPFAYSMNVDRFGRSYLGLMWFETHFRRPGQPMLRFCHEVSDLYMKEDGQYVVHEETGLWLIEETAYTIFVILTALATVELYKIRNRSYLGRLRIKKNPEEWARKYPGGKPGRKMKRK